MSSRRSAVDSVRWLGAAVVVAAIGMAPARASAEAPPATASWEPGQTVPFGYHVEHRPRHGLILAGAIVFGVSNFVITAVTIVSVSNGGAASNAVGAIPVGGPFALAYLASKSTSDDCGACGSVQVGLLVVDGLAQLLGGSMLAAGIAGKRVLVPNGHVGKIEVLPVPLGLGKNGSGLGLAGTF